MSVIEPRQKNVVRVIPRTSFDFSNLGAGRGMVIPIAQHIDVNRATQLSLAVRLHAANIPSGATFGTATGDFVIPGFPITGPFIGVMMDGDLWTPEDPTSGFTTGGSTAPLVGCPFTSQTSAPFSMIVSPPPPFGGLVFVAVLARQAQETAGPLSATISVDLILKGVDEDVADGGYNTYMGYR